MSTYTPEELKKKFWKALSSDRTVMLGLDGREGGHTRPDDRDRRERSLAHLVFTSTDNALVAHLDPGSRAIAAFAAKGHELFATVNGSLALSNDRAVIDRLWNPFIAAWYPGGKKRSQAGLAALRRRARRDLAE